MEIPLQTILGATLPVFLLLLTGGMLRRLRMLEASADTGIAKLIITLLYPCFFLNYLLGNPVVTQANSLILPPLAGFLTTAGGFAVAYWVARAIGLQLGSGLRTFALSTGIYNYGYIPIPLVLALFDDRQITAVLLLFNVGVEVAIWTFGVLLLAGSFRRENLHKLLNPPIMAVFLAILLNATGGDVLIPEWVSGTIRMLGNCAVPLGILLAGAAIFDLMRQSGLLTQFKVSAAAVGLRLGLLPAAFVAAAALLPWLSAELRLILVIQAAMPAGIFPIVMARHYHGEPPVAVKVVVVTTLMSALTMPMWIRLGLHLIG